MINTVSELLKKFVEGEKIALNKYNIKHRPTIGDMYEGLTKEIVNRSIFDGFNLNVSTQSFIEGCDTEFDVILSEGKGELIPYTDSYKFKPSQVIAVIQVKKTLSNQELRNSYDNLKQVTAAFQKNISSMDASMVDDSFRNICHKRITSYNKGVLNKQEESIYHTLVMDSFFPLRIVLGYNGYKTELGIRNSFVDFLESNAGNNQAPIKGFSPMSFPNLIISENYSLIKLTGCPYCVPLNNVREGWWEIMTSSHYNPMHFFLEMLWTKLSYRFHVIPSSIFGDDLKIEPHSIFLRTKIHLNNDEDPDGWEYEYSEISEEVLSTQNNIREWEPCVVDMIQAQMLNELNNHNINLNDAQEMESFVTKNGYSSLMSLVKSLEKKGLVSVEGNEVSLLIKQLVLSFSPDGNIYVFDGYDNKKTHWLLKKCLIVKH